MKFIKLTSKFDQEVYVNMDNVIQFGKSNDNLTFIEFVDAEKSYEYFKETPEEIMEQL